MPTIRQTFSVNNKNGIRARPAALFVKTATRFNSDITVEKDDQSAPGKSIMGLLTLACYPGSSLTIIADGDDAEAAVAALGELFESNFNNVDG